MKVLHIIDSLGLGGSQTIVKGLLECEPKEDSGTFLFSLRAAGVNCCQIDHPNLIASSSISRFSLRPLYELRDLIRRKDIQILHCHLMKSQILGFLLKIFYYRDITLVFHEHGAIISGTDNQNVFIDFLFACFLKISKQSVDGYIAVSDSIRDLLVRRLQISADRVKMIYNFSCLNPASLPVLPAKISPQAPVTYVVGFAGRLTGRKGWREFIEAAKLLKQDPSFEFRIAGDGPDRQKMLQLIRRKKLDASIRYLKYVSDMASFYKSLHCLVVPSHWEPFGLVVLEAQLFGVPVIASDVAGLRELVKHEDTGILTASLSATALADALRDLKNNPNIRQRLIKNGKRFAQQFNCENTRKQIHEFYEIIASESLSLPALK